MFFLGVSFLDFIEINFVVYDRCAAFSRNGLESQFWYTHRMANLYKRLFLTRRFGFCKLFYLTWVAPPRKLKNAVNLQRGVLPVYFDSETFRAINVIEMPRTGNWLPERVYAN